jgi:hypothetical protein
MQNEIFRNILSTINILIMSEICSLYLCSTSGNSEVKGGGKLWDNMAVDPSKSFSGCSKCEKMFFNTEMHGCKLFLLAGGCLVKDSVNKQNF